MPQNVNARAGDIIWAVEYPGGLPVGRWLCLESAVIVNADDRWTWVEA